KCRLLRKFLRLDEIIGAKYLDVIPLCSAYSSIERGRDTTVLGMRDHANSIVANGGDDVARSVGRRIVDDETLPIVERLAPHALERLPNPWRGVVRRDHDAYCAHPRPSSRPV